MVDNTIFKFVSASTQDHFMAVINGTVKELTEIYEDVWVQSISHDILTQYNGAFLYTALIACDVQGEQGEKGNAHEEDEDHERYIGLSE